MIEENLKTLINRDGTYDRVIEMIKKQQYKDNVRHHAQKIIADIRMKAMEKSAKLRQEIHAHSWMGNKTDQLVRKFAYKLLQRVRDKRDRQLQRVNKNIENTLVDKIMYLETVKNVRQTRVVKSAMIDENPIMKTEVSDQLDYILT